ncbi:MAG: Calx-beta domain-containing protein [Burkholderiaceae bacterium]
MTHYAPRTQSIQCRPHTEAGHTHFDVRLQAPTRAATPVKLWASCDADRDMHRASERDHGHDGHRDGGHDGRCHVSYDDGHSFHPVEHQVAQVPAGCSGFRVRVEHGSRHADVWDLNTQVHGRVSHCRGVPHEDREDHDRHQDHDRPQHPGSRDRHDDDEREGRHHDGRDHEREGRDGHDHDDHHRGDRHHGGRHGHGGDHDDDGGSPPPPRDPAVTCVSGGHAHEGEAVGFEVRLDAPADVTTRVTLALESLTADIASDLVPGSMQASFDNGATWVAVSDDAVDVPAGASGFRVRVATVDDAVHEGAESFRLVASAGGGSASAIGSICDNDGAPRVASVASARADEGDPLDFVVNLDHASTSAVEVALQLANGSATGGQDYAVDGLQVSFDGGQSFTPLAGMQVSVPAGTERFVVRVGGIDDVVDEQDEVFTLQASANGGTAQGIGTICDDDASVRIASVSAAQASEGDPLVFSVGLDGTSASETVVQVQLADGTATGGQDYATTGLEVSFDGGATYVAIAGTSVTVPAGATGFKVKVPGIEDEVFEGHETFTLQASTNGSTAQGIGTICEDDSTLRVLSVTGQDVVEGENLVFRVDLESSRAIKPPGSCCPPEEWTCTSGGGKGTIDLGDYKIELVEQGSRWILTNKESGAVTRIWGDPHVDVGNDGKNDFDFKHDMSFQLADGTKITVETVPWGSNGMTLSSKLTITDWCNKNAMVVSGLGSSNDGANTLQVEKFDGEGRALDLSTPDGSFTLYENGLDGWSIFDGRVATQSLVNQLEAGTLSDPLSVVTLTLSDGTAVSPADYEGKLEVSMDDGKTWTLLDANQVNVPSHVTGFLVRIPTIDDLEVESRETLTLRAAARDGFADGEGGILDNDVAPPKVVSVCSAHANEGDPLVFNVGMSGTSPTDTVVQLQLADGTATGGQDYATSGLEVSFDGGATYVAITGTSVTVPAGATGFQVKVPGIEDSVYEGNETFTLQASTNGSSAQGIGTICEDDSAVRVASVSPAQAHEGDPLVFTVGLDGTATTDTVVQLQLADGTATGGQDYATTGLEVSFDGGTTFVAISGTSVTVPAGASSFQVKVPGIEDSVFEGSEVFTLQASANGSSAQALGTILDDEAPVRVASVSNAQADEGDPLVFSVGLDGTSDIGTLVQLQLTDGTATGGMDYATTGLEVSFDGGATYVSITGTSVTVPAGASGFKLKVPSIADSVHEPTETFTLQASANGGSAQGIGTICDDDAAVRVVSVSSAQADEGEPLVFAVGLDGTAAADTIVQLQLADGTATGGQDYATTGLEVSFDGGATYVAITGTSVTVPAGATGFQVKVPGIEDSVYEGNETFTLPGQHQRLQRAGHQRSARMIRPCAWRR